MWEKQERQIPCDDKDTMNKMLICEWAERALLLKYSWACGNYNCFYTLLTDCQTVW